MGRVYLGGRDMPAKFRSTPVFGPFGAAAAAGKLLKLDEDQLTSALGFAANFAGGMTQCWLDGTKSRSRDPIRRKTGKRVAIGSLQDIEHIVAGEAGTNVCP
jgi:hypothetical protein